MYLVVTGGGTGGHVYPAIEVARVARDEGHEVAYFGSKRGLESGEAHSYGFPFTQFNAHPIYNFKSLKGLKAALELMKSSGWVMKQFRHRTPSAVFSTGGYSSGPVVSAAKRLRIPYVLHEANSVPGRSVMLFAADAFKLCYSFRSTLQHLDGFNALRTGHPIRRELRAASKNLSANPNTLFVVGGSQGSTALNEVVPHLVGRVGTLSISHITGPSHFNSAQSIPEAVADRLKVWPSMDVKEVGTSLASSALFLGRSGSMLAELAAFRVPAVLVPLPNAAGNHQYYNAMEFAQMGAASIISQESLSPEFVAEAIQQWTDAGKVQRAKEGLSKWDQPDAAATILSLLAQSTTAHA